MSDPVGLAAHFWTGSSLVHRTSSRPLPSSHTCTVLSWLPVAVGELDGRLVAVTSGHDGTVRVWDLARGEPIGQPGGDRNWLLRRRLRRGHTGAIFALAVAELDGRLVAVTGSRDKTVRVWDLADRRLGTVALLGAPISALVLVEPRCIVVGASLGLLVLKPATA